MFGNDCSKFMNNQNGAVTVNEASIKFACNRLDECKKNISPFGNKVFLGKADIDAIDILLEKVKGDCIATK